MWFGSYGDESPCDPRGCLDEGCEPFCPEASEAAGSVEVKALERTKAYERSSP